MNISHILGTAPRIPHGQNALESIPEFLVENRVYDRIKGRVRVSQPGEYLKGLSPNARLAERGRNVHTKERHPAYKKHAHYHAHCDSGLVIRDVIRRAVMQVAHLELLGRILGSTYALVALLFGHLAGSCHRLDGLHMLLGITVQSARMKGIIETLNQISSVDFNVSLHQFATVQLKILKI